MGGELEGVGDFVGEGCHVSVGGEGWGGRGEVLGVKEAVRCVSLGQAS